MPRILIIDDYDFISDVLEEALIQFGYQVTTASTGLKGLELFREEPHDLVITDIVMPDMDGSTVATLIRQSERSLTPIIAMSGTPWKLKNSVFDGVLAKPFPLQSLLEMVESLLYVQPPALEEAPVPVAVSA